MHLLTASRLVKFQRCARAHHYRYELGVAPVQSAPALAFGTAIHAALEAFWRAWMTDGYGSTEAALDALDACGLDPYALVKARVMVAAYCARYMRLAARSEVLAVEVEFSAPLVDPDSGRTSTRSSSTCTMRCTGWHRWPRPAWGRTSICTSPMRRRSRWCATVFPAKVAAPVIPATRGSSSCCGISASRG